MKSFLKTTATIIFFISLCFFLKPLSVKAATYYVSSSLGSDSNNGLSVGSPWQTVAKVNGSTFSPGDSILFKKGDAWHEELIPPSSGSVEAPITFGAYGSGASPVMSAGDLETIFASLGWIEQGSGLFYSGFESGNASDFTSTTTSGANVTAVQTTLAHKGQYAFKATFSGAAGDKNARVNKNITPSSDVYARAYFYFDNSFNIAAADSRVDIMYLRLDSSTNRVRVSVLRNSAGLLYLQGRIETPIATNFYIGTPGEMSKAAWHYIEVRYKGGDASAGGAELWLDGVSLGSNYSQNTSGLQVGRIEVGTNSSSPTTQPTAGSIMYVDDIVASTTPIGVFTAQGNDAIYLKSGITWTARQVFDNETALAASSDIAGLPAGSFALDAMNNKLYVHLAGEANPNMRTIELSRRNSAVTVVNKSYLVFDGLTALKGNNVSNAGIFLSGSNNIIIRNATLQQNYGSGINIQNGSSNNTVSNSTFSGNDREFGGSLRIETNSYDNIAEYNTMSGLINGSRTSNGINIRGDNGESARNIIRYNLIHDVQDTGIYIHENSNENQVYGNLIYSIDDESAGTSGGNGIHLGNNTGTITPDHGNVVYNNIIYDVATHGISMREGSYNNLIYNNTIFNVGVNRGSISGNVASGSGIDLHSSSNTNATGAANNIIKNNIVSTCATACLSVDSYSINAGGNIFDSNIFYNPGGSNVKWSGVSYADTDLAAYQTASAQDASSLFSDPLFLDTATANFNLQDSSPAIDSGINLGTAYKEAFLPSAHWPDVIATGDQSSFGAGWERGAYIFVDNTGPVISSIASSPTKTTATITWTTNEPATSTVSYGPTTSYGTTPTSASLVVSHSIELTGLSAGTLYHFQVSSTDASGNATTSADQTFVTIAEPVPPTSSTSSSGGRMPPYLPVVVPVAPVAPIVPIPPAIVKPPRTSTPSVPTSVAPEIIPKIIPEATPKISVGIPPLAEPKPKSVHMARIVLIGISLAAIAWLLLRVIKNKNS